MSDRKQGGSKVKPSKATPPPAKKAKSMVQARLPFALLNKEDHKKRKLSEESQKENAQKGPKLPRNDEPLVIIDDDSDEQIENVAKEINPKASNTGMMNKFVVKLPGEKTPKKDPPSQSEVSEEKTPEKSQPIEIVDTPDKDSTSSQEDNDPETPEKSEASTAEESTPKTSSSLEGAKKKTPDPARLKERQAQRARIQKEKDEKEKQRKEQKEKKELEKQQERERKEKERVALKEKKDREKQELKDKKEQERLEKEKEREEKKKQVEEEKKKKQEQKDEEKRKKQEVIDAKNAEKKQKEDEKKRMEDEKNKVKLKQKAVFTSFFNATSPKAPVAKPETETGLFDAFELKKNMYLAPSVRHSIEPSQKTNLDDTMKSQSRKTLYVKELKSGAKRGSSERTDRGADDDVEIVEPSTSGATRMKTKLLQFRENHRPAYYGTWRKKSASISGRAPFTVDTTHLDYEVDSDDEWEEEEPGESLSNSEGEGDDDNEDEGKVNDEEEDEDGFFVPHGYLSEGEGCEDDEDDNTPERLKARQQARAKTFEMDLKNMQKCELLKPKSIGCCWFNPSESGEDSPEVKMLLQFKAVCLVPSLPISLEAEVSAAVEGGEKEKKGPKLMPVPDEAVPELIRLVHGNSFSIQKLIKEFREYWHRKTLGEVLIATPGGATSVPGTPKSGTPCDTPSASPAPGDSSSGSPKPDTGGGGGGTPAQKQYAISKRQLDVRIRELATYEKREGYRRACWYVPDNLLDKHGLKDLPVPTEWSWITRVEKVKATPEVKKAKVKVAPEVTVALTPNAKNHPSPNVGRVTPTASSIKQFTKPNMSPLLFSPVTSKVASSPGGGKTEVLKPTPVKAAVKRKASVKRKALVKPDEASSDTVKPSDNPDKTSTKSDETSANPVKPSVKRKVSVKRVKTSAKPEETAEKPSTPAKPENKPKKKSALMKMLSTMTTKTGETGSPTGKSDAKPDPSEVIVLD